MKFRTLMSVVAAVALVAAFAVTVSAAQLNLGLVYDSSLKSDGATPAGYSLADGVPLAPGTVAPDDIHLFTVQLSLSGQSESPEESLQGVLLDTVLGPGLTPYAGVTYLPGANPSFDPPGLPAARNLFSTNEDSGPQDLLRITAITDNLAAHGVDPGEGSPWSLGTILLNWDGVTPTALSLAPAAETSDPWSLWIGTDGISQTTQNIFGSVNPDGPTNGFDLSTGGTGPDVPEPASITLFALAVVGLFGLRRRS